MRNFTQRKDHILVESEGMMTAHKKAPPQEKELRTVNPPRKPGQGTPQNPPSKDVGRTERKA